jgi:hypothetical protein
VTLTFLLCAARFFWIIDRFAVNLFTWDQWGFNDATVFQQHSLWEIFRWQWGPHRLGIAGVLSKILEPLSHWNTRSEAFGVGVVICVATLLALHLKKRLFGRLGWEDLIIPLVFLTPAQYEVVIAGEPPASFAVPLLLLIAYGLSWTVKAPAWKYACVLAANFFLIYTGYGIFMGPITVLLIAMEWFADRTATRIHASAFAIAVASLGSFFIDYRRLPTMGCPIPLKGELLGRFWFLAIMFANFLGLKVSQAIALSIAAGSVMAAATFIAALFFSRRFFVRSQSSEIRIVPFAFLGYSLVFCTVAAAGRGCLGLGLAESSRYVTPLIVGFFGLYLGALSMENRGWRSAYTALLLAIALMSSAQIHTQDRLRMNSYSAAKRAWRDCYLSSADVQACSAATHFYVIPRLDRTFIDDARLQQKLEFLKRNRLNLYSD